MITKNGRRLANSVLVGSQPVIGTHLCLGINYVAVPMLDGSQQDSDTVNRFHSPYIVDEIFCSNPGIVSSSGQSYLVFNGQANMNTHYMANTIGLIASTSSPPSEGQKDFVSVASGAWLPFESTNGDPTDVIDFTDDGYQICEAWNSSNNLRTYNLTNFNFMSISDNDIFAIPFTVHGVSSLTSPLSIALAFGFSDITDVVYIQQTLTNSSGIYNISGDIAENAQAGLVYDGKRIPFLFQTRLNEPWTTVAGVSAYQMLITHPVSTFYVQFSTPQAGVMVAFGNIKITSDKGEVSSRTNVAHRKLYKTLYKTDYESYVSAEYRLRGV